MSKRVAGGNGQERLQFNLPTICSTSYFVNRTSERNSWMSRTGPGRLMLALALPQLMARTLLSSSTLPLVLDRGQLVSTSFDTPKSLPDVAAGRCCSRSRDGRAGPGLPVKSLLRGCAGSANFHGGCALSMEAGLRCEAGRGAPHLPFCNDIALQKPFQQG